MQPTGVPVSEAYHAGGGDTLRVSEAKSPFAAQAPVPVLAPPEVFAVFVPARIDRAHDLLVGEHWVFLKLRDAEWFTERIEEAEAPVDGTASEEELAPLRSLRMESAVLPYRRTE